jgi:hypothetical protein
VVRVLRPGVIVVFSTTANLVVVNAVTGGVSVVLKAGAKLEVDRLAVEGVTITFPPAPTVAGYIGLLLN